MFSKINIKKLVAALVIVIVSSVTVGMIGLLVLDNNRFGSNIKDQFKIDIEKTISNNGINKINVKSVSSDIKIIPIKTNDIKVHLYGSASSEKSSPKLEIDTEQDSLNIKINHNNSKIQLFNANFYDLKLDVYIPEKYSDSLKLSTVSGKIQVNNMNFDKFESDSVSGGLNLSKVSFNEMKFTTTSGDANLKDIHGSVNYHSVSGRLDAVISKYDSNITISTISGNSSVVFPNNAEFELNFKTTSGDFHCDFPVTLQNNSKRNISGKVGSGKSMISFSSVSGSLTVNKSK